ncbi:MAG: MerC domain-containing protein [bacterium]|jgi:hypothetical protein
MFKINYDALGIAASIACAIHCAILPILLTSLPVLGINIINNIWFEIGMILLAAAIGFYSLRHGYIKHHHKKLPVVLFAVGILLLIVKQIFHAQQLLFLIPAVALIISAHLLNFRECSKANKCHTTGCIH